MRIIKGDTIKILSGKDRGKTGKVIFVNPEAGRVVVEGMNLVKKRTRPRKQGEKGQTVSVSRSINDANVMLVCPNCKDASRTGMRVEAKEKFRFCKKCEARI